MFKKVWVVFIIVLSLALNGVLIKHYIESSKQLNVTWSNAYSEFTKVLNWGVVHPQDTVNEYTLMTAKQNIQSLHNALDYLMILPEGRDLIPFATVQKINSLTNYEFRVIALLEEDINSRGKYSEENLERFRRINSAWGKMLSTLSERENKVNPFHPIFQKERWKTVWSDSIHAMEDVELMPLPE